MTEQMVEMLGVHVPDWVFIHEAEQCQRVINERRLSPDYIREGVRKRMSPFYTPEQLAAFLYCNDPEGEVFKLWEQHVLLAKAYNQNTSGGRRTQGVERQLRLYVQNAPEEELARLENNK